MLMPSIFGENLFDDDWMDFQFYIFYRYFCGNKNQLYGNTVYYKHLRAHHTHIDLVFRQLL